MYSTPIFEVDDLLHRFTDIKGEVAVFSPCYGAVCLLSTLCLIVVQSTGLTPSFQMAATLILYPTPTLSYWSVAFSTVTMRPNAS